MQKIILDLSPQSSPAMKKIQRILFAVLGAGNLYQGFTIGGTFRYVNFSIGILALVFSLYFNRFYNPKEYVFSEDGIEGPTNGKTKIHVKWDDVSSVEMKKRSMNIFLKNGTVHALDLSDISYDEHMIVIPELIEFMRSKNIAVRTI